MLKIGGYISACLEDHDLTQKKFAELIDISPRALSRYLSDLNFPPLDVLSRMCNELNIDLNDILEIHAKGNEELLISNADQMEVCKALKNATPEEYAYLMRGIRYLISEIQINKN